MVSTLGYSTALYKAEVGCFLQLRRTDVYVTLQANIADVGGYFPVFRCFAFGIGWFLYTGKIDATKLALVTTPLCYRLDSVDTTQIRDSACVTVHGHGVHHVRRDMLVFAKAFRLRYCWMRHSVQPIWSGGC
jgi:hypothetical protein